MTISLTHGTHEDCVLAASVIGNCKVVSCANPADAACPVYLHAGDHVCQIGQSADWRHDLAPLLDVYEGAALVQGWWDNNSQRWRTTIDGLDHTADAWVGINDFVRRREQDRAERTAAEQREAAAAEQRRTAAEERSRIADVMDACRQAAEAWAPGRVAVRTSNDREIIVGRWDSPLVPGYGLPAEVRRVIRGSDGQPVLVACGDAYRYVWM